MGLNMSRCYICQQAIEGGNLQIPSRNIILNDNGKTGTICWECNQQINGKAAIVVERYGIRTGEVIFISRKALKEISPNSFDGNYSIFIVAPNVIRELINALIKNSYEKGT